MNLSIETLSSFVLEHHPYAWQWGEERCKNWVDWFTRHGYVIAGSEDQRNIHGLGLIRTVLKAEDGLEDTLRADPEGPVVFADFIYAPTDRAQRALMIEVVYRIGARPIVAWERPAGVLHEWKAAQFARRILKKEKHYGWPICTNT